MDDAAPMEPYEQDRNAVGDYRQQSLEFLGKARQYLAEGDLHQASEKGWGAAAWMAKAVAESQGWQYRRHHEFHKVMRQTRQLSGDGRLIDLEDTASKLHEFYYTRKVFLHPDDIGPRLDRVALLLDILQPLTEGG